MIRRLCMCAILAFAVTLTGCAKDPGGESVDGVSGTESVAEIDTENAADLDISQYSSQLYYSVTDRMPLLSDGRLYGYLQINQVEHINFADWYNKTAKANGITDSYSINYTLDLVDPLSSDLTVTPYLVNKHGEKISDVCNVGWTGFPTTAIFYDGSTSATFEIGLQPTKTFKKSNVKLCIEVSSADVLFDTIQVSKSIFSSVVEGPGLLSAADTAVIDSANGAKYTMQILNAYYDKEHLVSEENDTPQEMIDFVFREAYVSAPTNDNVVAAFDKSDSNSLSVMPVIGVLTNIEETTFYENHSKALRKLYADDDVYTTYVPKTVSNIGVGHYAKYTQNRVVDFVIDPSYCRFRIELPEEAAAMSTKELLKFNGRFLVFQLPFEERSLENAPED